MRLAKSKEYEMAIKIAGEIEKSFYNSTKLTKKELQNIAKTASTTSSGISQSFSKGLKDAAPAFEGIEKAGAAAFHAVATAATVAATAVAAVVAASVAVGASFEAQMSTVQAISGASASEMEDLNDLAKELGATTQFTATEVGQAMEYMAMAGWKTQDMLDGMAGVLNLAAASGEDLATTSDIVTDAMTAFGMGADEVDHFADVLAATATNSNTTVSMMGESFTYAASLAGALGYSIEDTSIALGLMANSGIKASQAGTALRKFFSETTNGAKVSARAFGDMEIATTNSDGSMRDLKDIIVDLRGAFSQMTESEKAANAEAIAGKTGMSGLLAIVNASETDYTKLTNAIYDCTGAAEEMADIRLDNLSGDVTIFKSALEGVGIQIYEGLNEPLREAVQWATQMLGKFSTKLASSGFLEEIGKKLPTVIRKTEEFTEALTKFAQPFLTVAGWLVEHPGVIVGAIVGIGTAIATYKVASGIMSIVTALGALGPVGWAILGIAGVAAVITGIGTAVKKSAAEAKKANLASHFGDISLSLEDLDEVASHVISNGNLGTLQEALSKFDELDNLQRNIDETVQSLNKANWKVSIGMELTDEEKDQYQSDIADYVANCQQYLQDDQYALTLAIGVLTDGVDGSDNVITKVNDFYADKQQELADLGTKLNETITEAFQDGLLDIDEVKEITELQAQIAEIQSQLAGSSFDANLDLLSMKYSGGDLDAESFANLQAEIQKQVDEAVSGYDEAYTASVQKIDIMLDDGAIDQSEYDSMLQTLKEGYLENVGEIELKANNFQLDTIMQQYSDELGDAMPEFQSAVDEALQGSTDYINSGLDDMELNWNVLFSDIGDWDGLDKDTKAALTELYEQMAPSVEQLEELKAKYKEYGMEIPQSIQDGINDTSKLGAMTGNYDAIWNALGDAAESSEAHTAAIQKAQEQGWYVPEELATAIEDNKSAVSDATDALNEQLKADFDRVFSAGFKIDVPVEFNLIKQNTQTEGWAALANPGNVAKHAAGGIFTQAHMGIVAEAGTESVIPVDGSNENAVSLWTQTGQMMGLLGSGEDESSGVDSFETLYNDIPAEQNSQEVKIEYNPTFQFYGEAPSKEDLKEATDDAQEKFNRMMDNYMRQNSRLKFS